MGRHESNEDSFRLVLWQSFHENVSWPGKWKLNPKSFRIFCNFFFLQYRLKWLLTLISIDNGNNFTFETQVINQSEIIMHAALTYLRSLRYGPTFLDECMPRLLTIWLDFGAIIQEALRNEQFISQINLCIKISFLLLFFLTRSFSCYCYCYPLILIMFFLFS